MSLAKLARSFDAQRKKQYWQLLKRLYGGTDEAVQELSKTRDPGIYHGTNEKYVSNILEHGIQPGPYREFGTGSFFGSKRIANLYAKLHLIDHKGEVPSLGEAGIDTLSLQRLKDNSPAAYNQKVDELNQRGIYVSEGILTRFKQPSELQGTKLLYPDVKRAKVFDVQGLQSIRNAASRNFSYLQDTPFGFEDGRAVPNRNSLWSRWGTQVFNHHIAPLTDEQANAWLNRLGQPDAPSYIDPRVELMNEIAKQKLDRLIQETPVTSQEAYGKLGKRRLFELNRDKNQLKRHEMFFDQTTIPPKLLHVPSTPKNLSQ